MGTKLEMQVRAKAREIAQKKKEQHALNNKRKLVYNAAVTIFAASWRGMEDPVKYQNNCIVTAIQMYEKVENRLK